MPSLDEAVPYGTAEAFRAALTDRIATAAGSQFTISQLRRQFAYDRLLSRLFAAGDESWILKGAGSLLARIPGHARHSLDVDLFRYRDLVDLVVIAGSQHVDAQPLHHAMLSEYAYRGLPLPTEVTLPSDKWIAGYKQAAKSAPNLTHTTAADAVAFVATMLNPVLTGRDHGTQNPEPGAWED